MLLLKCVNDFFLYQPCLHQINKCVQQKRVNYLWLKQYTYISFNQLIQLTITLAQRQQQT